jgi:hypothetical protein
VANPLPLPLAKRPIISEGAQGCNPTETTGAILATTCATCHNYLTTAQVLLVTGAGAQNVTDNVRPCPLKPSIRHNFLANALLLSKRTTLGYKASVYYPRPRNSALTNTEHGTRANAKKPPLQHIAATAKAYFTASAPESPKICHTVLHGNAFNPDTGKLAEFVELSKSSEGTLWQQSNADKIGQLAQGHGKIKGTNTIVFIDCKNIPKGRKVTYLRVVCAFCPEKENPCHVQLTVGGDHIEYPGDVSTKTANLCTAKLLFNSVVSTPEAKFMTGKLTDFYLGTPMDRYEYMRIPVHMIPDAIIEEYNLTPLIHNGFVSVEIQRGMYGLPQAGKVANNQLVKFLSPHGYTPVPLTHRLWRHSERTVTFTLVVDDFGVKYTKRDDAEHLITTLEQYDKVSTDWTGSRYCGLMLDWDYTNQTCNVSMPGYIERALQRFQHTTSLLVPEPARHTCKAI